jgi:HNH endonuclease
MNAALRAFVRERAGCRCEYCRLHEDDADFLAFHVDHVVAKQRGGADDPNTLCFSCSECNWAKGPNLAGILGGKLYPLFNPRKQSWKRHFRWDNTILVGKTFSGRVTVQVLNIKEPSRVMLRENLLFEGRFPFDE